LFFDSKLMLQNLSPNRAPILGAVLRLLCCKKSAPVVQKSGPDFALKQKNKKRIFQREICSKF